MLLAALRDTGYNIVLFLHVLTVIVAMAGAVAHPLMFAVEQRREGGDIVRLAQVIDTPSRVYVVSYALTGLIGFGLVSMGDWSWGEAWIWLSIVLWLASNGVLHGMLLPAERALAGGDTTAIAKLDKVSPILMVMILGVVFLMTVKPGADVLGSF